MSNSVVDPFRSLETKLWNGRFRNFDLPEFWTAFSLSAGCHSPKNGGASRDRTGDLKLAKLALSQLSYGPDLDAPPSLALRRDILRTRRACRAEAPEERRMVGLGRFELPTSRLSSARSNQLSYKPNACTLGKVDRDPEAGCPEEERETKTAASRKMPVRLNRLMFPMMFDSEEDPRVKNNP